MICGSKSINEDTDIHDLANVVAVWQILKDNHGQDFGRYKQRVMYALRAYLDNYAKRIKQWDYEDLTRNNTDVGDYCTSIEVVSHIAPGDGALWTLECIVGWSLNDAAVQYTFYSANEPDKDLAEHYAAIACDIWRLKIDWCEAVTRSAAENRLKQTA